MTAATATERETESFRDGRAPFSPGEVPRSHTRVWFIVVVAALLYLLWRVVRATAA